MKIDFKSVERFIKAPDPAARAILVFGADDGLVRERAAALARTIVPDLGDPFRVAEFSGEALVSDPALLVDATVKVAVQVNGKLRATIDLPRDAPEAQAREVALAQPNVAAAMAGKPPRKVIVVPNRIVNVVA